MEECLRVHRHPLFHGAGSASAGALLRDRLWLDILEQLMPAVYEDIHGHLCPESVPPINKLFQAFENNPVMAAFVALSQWNRRQTHDEELPAFEWDIFIPRRLDPTSRYTIAQTTIIAHGNFINASMAYVGRDMINVVSKLSFIDGGGLSPPAWMDVYARALLLGTDRTVPPTQFSMDEAVQLHAETFPGDRFRVGFDVKQAQPEQIDELQSELSAHGIQVRLISWFKSAQLRRITPREGTRRCRVFHFANEAVRALKRGEWVGDAVFFNGASLIKEPLGVGRVLVKLMGALTGGGSSSSGGRRRRRRSGDQSSDVYGDDDGEQEEEEEEEEEQEERYGLELDNMSITSSVQSQTATTTNADVTVTTTDSSTLSDVSTASTATSASSARSSIFVERYSLNTPVIAALSAALRSWSNANPSALHPPDVGIYLQEASLDTHAYRLIAGACNRHADIITLGLSWGGVNGLVDASLVPSLFSSTTGRGVQWFLDARVLTGNLFTGSSK